MSHHTVLVVDRGTQDSSPIYQALVEHRSKTLLRHSYKFAFFSLDQPVDQAAFDHFRSMLRLDAGLPCSEYHASLLRLRGIVFDRDRVAQSTELVKLVRNHFPGLFVGYVSEQPERSYDQNVIASMGFDCCCVADGALRYPRGAATTLSTLDTIIEGFYLAPYWEALRTYASKRLANFHALPIGQARSATPSIADFVTFYSEGLFSAETSLYTAPLDSLLNPQSTILRAQQKAAIAFGSALFAPPQFENYGTCFVTSGTSAANRIVISAFVKPGDYVLIDRSCHESHYYALAYAHANPIIVEPFYNPLGIAGPISIERLSAAFRLLLVTRERLPAAVILTNPTFDGIYFRPELVVDAFREVLTDFWREHRGTERLEGLLQSVPRVIAEAHPVKLDREIDEASFLVAAFRCIVFLFDEAWSAHGFFHPKLVQFTAMHAAIALAQDDPQVYAKSIRFYTTQSTHKSLSAFRQGSMIHYRDPVKHLPDLEQRFSQSFRAHTTTSPNASIIASLDVARRQAQIDGMEMIDNCMRLAERFRRSFAKPVQPFGRGFYAVEEAEMLAPANAASTGHSPAGFYLDPSRVTITWDFAVTGVDVRRLLLDHGIQVNKFDARSVLAIFNIGCTDESLDALCCALRSICELLEESRPDALHDFAEAQLPPRIGAILDDKNLGWWMKNLGDYRCIVLDVEEMYNNIMRSGTTEPRYISANFVTTYPPGYPILIPGQAIEVHDLQYLQNMAVRDMLGVRRVNGQLKIAAFVLPDSGNPMA